MLDIRPATGGTRLTQSAMALLGASWHGDLVIL